MNGKFVPQTDKCVVCPHHGWKLNLETMNYENPSGLSHSRQLDVKIKDSRVFFEDKALYSVDYWNESRDKKSIEVGEFGISYYSHACVQIIAGKVSLFTDPWLYGPAFTNGWWLLHKAPATWREDIARSSGIYLSHNHSDHMSTLTLKEIVGLNPALPLYIPNFADSDMESVLSEMGFTNINVLKFNEWFQLNEDTHFMILPDETGRQDSGLLFEYKGYRILSTVDCGNCCSGELPKDIDVFLSSFAAGATGYPVTWEDMYSVEKINEYLTRNRRLMITKATTQLGNCGAKAFIPYAGFFTEAHPDDQRIKDLNVKNSPEDIIKSINETLPLVKTHSPISGDFFDISFLSNTSKAVQENYSLDTWDIENFSKMHRSEPLSIQEIIDYFEGLHFQDAQDLHILECSDDFKEVYREFTVDFSKEKDLVSPGVLRNLSNSYQKMKVRQGTFSFVLREKLPWEELSIGFQCRFSREPDVYNFAFWDRMQNVAR